MSSWTDTGDAYAASYAGLCLGTVESLHAVLGPGNGRSLLDAGSGVGDLAARFADLGWQVAACEPETSMRRVARRRRPTLRVVDGALPELPFTSEMFDAVIANFVLNHVEDPRAAAAELARVAAPGGVLAATIWTVPPSGFWRAVCETAGLTPEAGQRLPEEKDFERTASGFTVMLAAGGWSDVRCDEHRWTWQVSPSALWASVEGGVASAGAFYRALNDAERASFRSAFDKICGRLQKDGAVPLAHTAAVATGRPPG